MTAVFRHFLRRLTRDRGLLVQAGAFFALALMVCVFSIGSEDVLLLATLPGLSWAALLLASLLGLPDLLPDEELDDLILARVPLAVVMSGKMFAHFTATTLPIALAAPIFLFMALPHADLPMVALWLGFLLSGATFSAIGLMGSALTLHSRRNAALQALIVMPLCIPPLIFGAGAISSAQLDLGWHAPMAFLGAIAAAAITLSPFAAAKIIRMKVTSS